MKNIIIALVVIVAMSSCQKRGCYTCTSVRNNGYTTPTITSSRKCEATQSEIEKYQEQNTRYWNNGGVLASDKMTCISD